MPSTYETFWTHRSFAVVGHTKDKPFPELTYGYLKTKDVKVFAVDPSVETIDDDPTYPDLAALPEPVEAIVLEVPPEQTAGWVEAAAEAGIEHVWIHQGTDTPEALELATQRGLDVRHGTCAVMYLTEGFAQGHGIHRFFRKALGRY